MAVASYSSFTGTEGRLHKGVATSKGTGYFTMRSPLVLTTSYVASSHVPVAGFRSLGIDLAISDAVDYTSITVLVEGATTITPAAGDWHALPASATDIARTYTLADLSAATNRGVIVPVDTSAGIRHVRFHIKRTGGTAVGTVGAVAVGGV